MVTSVSAQRLIFFALNLRCLTTDHRLLRTLHPLALVGLPVLQVALVLEKGNQGQFQSAKWNIMVCTVTVLGNEFHFDISGVLPRNTPH